MSKRHGKYESSKYKELQDDFEDFGYEVKNIRRQSKKKVNKFKREVDEYYDSYWTGPLAVASLDFLCHLIRVNTTPTLMRKIEQQMCLAVQQNKNWKSGNTEVVTNDGVSTVYLHGNKIALVDDTSLTIFDGGWQSNTTKSRLNALCSEFCIAGEGVFQKDFLWYVRKFVGQSPVTGKVFNVEDFHSGYVFAWYHGGAVTLPFSNIHLPPQ